jgi:hypothetical protein
VHPVANHFSAFFFQGHYVRISVIAASSAWISASTSFYLCCCCCKSRLLLEQGTRLDRFLRCSEGFVERTICSVFLEIKTPSTRTRLLRIMSLVISAVFCIRTLVDSVQFHCLISLYACTTSYASHSLIFLFRCIVLHCFDASELQFSEAPFESYSEWRESDCFPRWGATGYAPQLQSQYFSQVALLQV